jgi:uncharacterized membrane protein
MKPLLKLLHLVAAIGYVGALAVLLLLSLTADDSTALAFAAARRTTLTIAQTIGLPSLVLLLLTGMLLTTTQPALLEARWLWAKALLGMLVGGIALLVVQPAVMRAAALAQMSLDGSPSFRSLEAALGTERIGVGINLLLCLAAMALAVWRPRLGGGSRR